MHKGLLQNAALVPFFKHLPSQDVGALTERPRAVNNRPYKFYWRISKGYPTAFHIDTPSGGLV